MNIDTQLLALAKDLNLLLHEPTDNETRWIIIEKYLRMAYNNGVYDGKQEERNTLVI